MQMAEGEHTCLDILKVRSQLILAHRRPQVVVQITGIGVDHQNRFSCSALDAHAERKGREPLQPV